MLNGTLPGAVIDAPDSISTIIAPSSTKAAPDSISTTIAPSSAKTTTSSTTMTSSSHPPPVHSQNGQSYNIHQRIRQPNGHGISRANHSPSIRQSWLFPTSRASPSTASPETTLVMTLNQRPKSTRTEAVCATAATAQSVPPSVIMNHRERRNFGSARTRLDRLNRMSLNPHASVPNLQDGSPNPPNPTSPRRARMSITVTEALGSPNVIAINSSEMSSRVSTTTINPLTSSSNSYPRHIIMSSTSPHCTIEDQLEGSTTAESLSSSLPTISAFPPGVEASLQSEYIASSNTEKSSKHSSMPLPRPGWRLHDRPDNEEIEPQHSQSDGSGFGSSISGEERNSFQYSASNASSTTNLDNNPYSHHAHARQDSNGTYYTMTPNASALDLSSGSDGIDPLTTSPSDSNQFTIPGSQSQGQGSFATSPPLPKAVKNAKSPLALRRSSTISSTSSSSLSNTLLSKGSLQKSTLSSNTIYSSKTLTLERQKIILEILRTEQSYVEGLDILQTCFYEPLNAPYVTGNSSGMNTAIYGNSGTINTIGSTFDPVAGFSSSPIPVTGAPYYASSTMGSNSTLSTAAAPLLSKKSVGLIFSNFPEIHQINLELLAQLENRICGWESDNEEAEDRHDDEGSQCVPSDQQEEKQKPEKVWVTVGGQGGEQDQILVLDKDWCVGDIFIEIAPFLKMYSNYVKAFESALTHVNDCMKSSDRFTEFLKATARRPECKNLDFQAYFMLPIQRIPRYKLLLENLLRHTPSDHPDHSKLQIAFKSMEQTAGFVNAMIRQHEMFEEMVNLQSKITGMSEPLVVPGRVLLKRGRVSKVSRRNIHVREIILFSDCILWTSPSMNPLDDTLAFHRKVELETCTVIGAEDPDPARKAFQIMSPDKSSQVFVETAQEKEDWIAAIRIATEEHLSAKRTLKPTPTPLQNIGAAATSFGAGLLRRETGLWSPAPFGNDLRTGQMCIDPEIAGPLSSPEYKSLSDRKLQQPLRVVENYSAPIWVPDHSVSRCMICTEEFGFYRRRHHCRACGKVVCHSCSTRTILIKSTDSEKVGRACDDCIEAMFPEEINMFDSGAVSPASLETLPVDQQQQQQQQRSRGTNSDPERRASSQSLDGVVIRPEDYLQESNSSSGATGMVRGFVEAGLSRIKSRSNPPDGNNSTKDSNSKENTRASNRKSDSHFRNSIDYQNANQVKECGLCKAEFRLFKWRNICSQCRRVVCSDCLTKKQIDQLFLLGLQAEREANARGIDIEAEGLVNGLSLQSNSSDRHENATRPGMPQSASDSVVGTGTNEDTVFAAASQRSQSFNDSNINGNGGGREGEGGGYGSFGNGRRGTKGNIDSGIAHGEKLCDPCYLGLSADHIKVLESGGGWQYYQATLGKHQAPGLAAALALSNMSLDDNDSNGGQQTYDL
ncbi:hypothetical protein BGZ46_010217 [Entomortierella lignicola]|nr:hypothetical protein BGZ46_010217 [Entomortierella lignicola]